MPSPLTRTVFVLLAGCCISSVFAQGEGKAADSVEELFRLKGAGDYYPAVAFSQDSKRIAYAERPHDLSGDYLGVIIVYDLAEVKIVRRLKIVEDRHHPKYLVFSRSGEKLAMNYSSGNAWIWDIATGQAVKMARDASKESISDFPPFALSPDGKMFIAKMSRWKIVGTTRLGEPSVLQFWDATTGKQTRRIGPEAFDQEPRGLHHFALSDDGMLMLTEHWEQVDYQIVGRQMTKETQRLTARLVELHSGRDLGPFGKPLQFDYHFPDREKQRKVDWPIPKYRDGDLLRELGAPPEGFLARTSPTGRMMLFPRDPQGAVLTASLDKNRDTLILRDLISGKELHRVGDFQDGQIEHFALAPDSSKLAMVGRLKTANQGGNPLIVYDLSALRNQALNSRVPPTKKELEALWQELGTEEPIRALRASRRLTIDPAACVDLIEQHVKPVKLDVTKEIKSRIPLLDDPAFPTRQRAETELRKLAESNFTAREQTAATIRQALTGSISEETRRRLQKLLAACLDDKQIDPPTRRQLWSIELLERLGTPEAHRLLERFAEGVPGAWVTLEARAALVRGRAPVKR